MATVGFKGLKSLNLMSSCHRLAGRLFRSFRPAAAKRVFIVAVRQLTSLDLDCDGMSYCANINDDICKTLTQVRGWRSVECWLYLVIDVAVVFTLQGNSVLENHHWHCLVCFLKRSHMCDHFTTDAWSVALGFFSFFP